MTPRTRIERHAWLLAALTLVAGCGGPPQVGANNYRLIDSMRTAISAHRVDWLDDNAKAIDQRHAQGEMSDEQFAAFESILALARAERWDDAESEVVRLAKAQRATPEEIEQRKARPPAGRKR